MQLKHPAVLGFVNAMCHCMTFSYLSHVSICDFRSCAAAVRAGWSVEALAGPHVSGMCASALQAGSHWPRPQSLSGWSPAFGVSLLARQFVVLCKL